MDKIYEVCNHCSEKHCCRGLCKEMNEFLIKKGITDYQLEIAVSGKKSSFNRREF